MEKCMMTASVAFLLCHPNSSIKCSNPCKQNKKLNSKQQEKPRRKPSPPVQLKPHKCQLITRLRLVYDHLGSTQYPSIQALDRILRRGWNPNKQQGCSRLVIDKVLKVKHKDGFVEKFDKYREIIKGKASTDINVVDGVNKKLREDGFELLSFIGAKLACLPRMLEEGVHNVCRKRYCGVCRLIRIIESSSLESLHSLSVSENVWMAHQKAIKVCGDDQLGCRKAVVICRVIAGRIADYRRWRGHGPSFNTGEPDDEFDSVFVPVASASDSHDELLVFNPSAILPCFVILYNVQES